MYRNKKLAMRIKRRAREQQRPLVERQDVADADHGAGTAKFRMEMNSMGGVPENVGG